MLQWSAQSVYSVTFNAISCVFSLASSHSPKTWPKGICNSKLTLSAKGLSSTSVLQCVGLKLLMTNGFRRTINFSYLGMRGSKGEAEGERKFVEKIKNLCEKRHLTSREVWKEWKNNNLVRRTMHCCRGKFTLVHTHRCNMSPVILVNHALQPS